MTDSLAPRPLRPEELTLDFGLADNHDPDAPCAHCTGDINPYSEDWRAVAVALYGPNRRICRTCTEGTVPGLWTYAEGLQYVIDGLDDVPAGRRSALIGALLTFTEFVAKFYDDDQDTRDRA